MKVKQIIAIASPIQSDISNAYIKFSAMTVSVVAIVTDALVDGQPLVGYGYSSNGRYAVTGPLKDRFIPRLLDADPELLLNEEGSNFDPHRAWQVMMTGEKPGGHGERAHAVGILDMALWDLVGKVEQRPLSAVLADRFRDGQRDDRVFVYAAGGYYHPGKDTGALQEEMRGYLDQGFRVVKMKIGGVPLEEDLRRLESVLQVVDGASSVAVDANARFDVATALAYADALQPYGVRWYEEPCDPLDYAGTAEVALRYSAPLATGENLFSVQDATNLVRHGGLRADRDILQFDISLSYGIVEYLRILAAIGAHGWSPRQCIPHGGHQMAIHAAAGLGLGGNELYPGVFQPFGMLPETVQVEDGYVRPPDAPGIGLEQVPALYGLLRELAP